MKWQSRIRLLSIATILASIVILARLLPTDRLIALLSSRVDQLGVWAAVAFAGLYVLGAVLFVPGSAMTLAAGAVFGLVRGTILVSLASTTAAAVAFLIGRYFARNAVQRRASANPRFAAIDRAIGAGGWKIIALLRLSPVVPFSLGNYLFGLTSIRFWPYVLTSWLAMLPGTFLYVYLGYAGRAGLAVAAGSGSGRSPAQWAMLAVGLAATLAVTAYVTRLARKAVHESAAMFSSTEPAAGITESVPSAALAPSAGRWVPSTAGTPLASAPSATPADDLPVPAAKPASMSAGDSPRDSRAGLLGTLAVAALAVSIAGCTAFAYSNRTRLSGLFGPPVVAMGETYADLPDGPAFDHSRFDALLRAYVDDAGRVDYAAIQADPSELDAYIASLAEAPVEAMGRNQRLSLLINAYNAFTLRLIIDHYPLKSIKDIPAADRWEAVRWNVGGNIWSLNQIEHEQIRPHFAEPRIHFALVCAAVGCPPLRAEAYTADSLDQQLAGQTRYVHTHDRWFRYDPSNRAVGLTSLYDWYAGDFEQAAGSVLRYVAGEVPQLSAEINAGREPKIEFLDYDWSLNDRGNQ